MAEETKPEAAEATPTTEVAVTEEKAAAPVAAEAEPTAAAEDEKKPSEEEAKTEEPKEAAILQSVSFKEESNVVADLEDPEKKALDEFKLLISAALSKNEFTPPPPPPVVVVEAPVAEDTKTEEVKQEETTAAVAAEEVKVEDSAAPLTTAVAAEEVKAEETTEEITTEPTPEAKTEEPKAEEPKAEEPPSVVEPVAEEKAVVLEEAAATKTVEAIEETVVPTAAGPEEVTTVTEPEAPVTPAEEVFIWGVPLVGDEKSDTVLLKFLRARDFKVKDALAMVKNAVIWRKQFGIDSLVEEDLEIPELERVVFNHGFDKEGHPVCYNVYGEFQDKDLYAKAFGDEEKREKFLRWRIQYLEKGIRQQLDFTPGSVCSMVQVTDLKNVPGPGKRELRLATKKALALLQDNYPEFVAKQVFINVPWWYLAYNRMISPFFTQRTRSKFVFAGPSKSAETLFKYIAPEQVPVQYGGLSKDNDSDFTTADVVTEVTIKPSSKHTIQIPATEACLLVWEFRVLGWEVTSGAEFVPTAEDGYTVIVQKARKLVPTDEPVVKNSFKIGEPGKIVLTIDNATSKKKKLLYRFKVKSSSESI